MLLLGTLLMIACSKDPCAGNLCRNDGVCVDGTCNCLEGFEGADCSVLKTPTSMKISQIRLLSYPASKPDGSSWDLLDGADLQMEFCNTGTSLCFSTTEIGNTVPNNTNQWSVDFTIDDPEATYMITLTDKDLGAPIDADDLISSGTITPWQESLDSSFTYTLTSGMAVFEMDVSYQY